MRHATDGELHAFLDGALDLLPEGRGQEVREHLSTCRACRERLQDEETIRESAGKLLGEPDLGEVGIPPFEKLREMAAAPRAEGEAASGPSEDGPRYRGPLRGLPLAWAATIVLALGVGWMGGEIWRTAPTGGPSEPGPGRYAPPDPGSALQTRLADDSTAGLRSSSPRAEGQAVLSEVSAPAEGQAPRQAERVGGAGAGLPAGDPLSDQRERVVLDPAPDRQAPATRADSSQPSAGVRETQTMDLNTAVVSAPAEALLRSRTEDPSVEAVTPISDDLRNSLAVPGLKVSAIQWEEGIPGEKALLIRQVLSPGDTLELRYLGMLLGSDTEPVALRNEAIGEETSGFRAYANMLQASLPTGWSQVVMEKGRGLLIARGPISEGNLKALLKTFH